MIPATDNAQLYARVQVAAAYPTSDMSGQHSTLIQRLWRLVDQIVIANSVCIAIGVNGNLATEGCAGQMMFHEPSSTTLHKMFHWTGYVVDTVANGFRRAAAVSMKAAPARLPASVCITRRAISHLGKQPFTA
jgi:hypothetical protein